MQYIQEIIIQEMLQHYKACLMCFFFLKVGHLFTYACHIQRNMWSTAVERNDHKSLDQEDFFAPPLASCCKMMNSRMSFAVRQGLSITTECPQLSSRSTLHPGNASAMTAAPETSTTWANTGQLSRLCGCVTWATAFRLPVCAQPHESWDYFRSKSCRVISSVFI